MKNTIFDKGIFDKDIDIGLRIENIFRAIEAEILRDEQELHEKGSLESVETTKLKNCKNQIAKMKDIYSNELSEFSRYGREIEAYLDRSKLSYELYAKVIDDLKTMIDNIRKYEVSLSNLLDPNIDATFKKKNQNQEIARELTLALAKAYNKYLNANEDAIRILKIIKLAVSKVN